MPATLPAKKRSQGKKMAARRAPLLKTKGAVVAAPASRPRRLSAKQILSDKAADFFNAFLD